MKRTAFITAALCAISSVAFAQSTRSVIIIPAFQNHFAGIHQPVVALQTVNSGPTFQTRTFGGPGLTSDPAAGGVVRTPLDAARGRLDPTVVNIPVFPGNTVLLQQQAGFGFGGVPFGFPANTGFGNTGFFMQQGGGSSQVDPLRNTATPGPAVNAVPDPAAPVPPTQQLQPNTGTMIPLQQQDPGTAVPVIPNQVVPTPAQAVPGSPAPVTPTPTRPGGSGQDNR